MNSSFTKVGKAKCHVGDILNDGVAGRAADARHLGVERTNGALRTKKGGSGESGAAGGSGAEYGDDGAAVIGQVANGQCRRSVNTSGNGQSGRRRVL